jgi:hypothetical protein
LVLSFEKFSGKAGLDAIATPDGEAVKAVRRFLEEGGIRP